MIQNPSELLETKSAEFSSPRTTQYNEFLLFPLKRPFLLTFLRSQSSAVNAPQ